MQEHWLGFRIPLRRRTGAQLTMSASEPSPKNQLFTHFARVAKALEALRRQGFRARRLDAGYPEWKAARLPVARASR